MANLTYSNLIELFLEEFPEFQKKADEEKDYWHGDDQQARVHVFFNYILIPFLAQEALVKGENTALLDRIFTFLEKMATSKDDRVRAVLGTAILENLGDDKRILRRTRKIMLPKTLKISKEIESGFGRAERHVGYRIDE